MAGKEKEEKREIIEKLIETYEIKSAKDIHEALKDLLGETIEEMLEMELEEQLGYEKYGGREEAKSNYRNGYKSKRVRSSLGEIELEIPQDRKSEFEPKIVPKHKREVSEIESKIIGMYGRGLSTREIGEQIEDIYGFEASADLISRVASRITLVLSKSSFDAALSVQNSVLPPKRI